LSYIFQSFALWKLPSGILHPEPDPGPDPMAQQPPDTPAPDGGKPRGAARRLALAVVWGVLVVMAAVRVTGTLILGVSGDDTMHLETTLADVAGGQFIVGPGALYGPYTGENHRVLIQAPLYYRLTGLAAWPLTAAGLGPGSACLVSGRLISLAAFLACAAAAARLAALDGAPRRAAPWAVALVAASPIAGPLAVTVRPDMLGVALQTVGTWLVLRAARAAAPSARGLVPAYVAFGLAACVKQHDVAPALLCSAYLAGVALRRPGARGAVAAALLTGLAVAAVVYGAEQAATSGMLWETVVETPVRFRRYAMGGGWYSLVVLVGVVFSSSVPFALGLAGAWATLGRWRVGRCGWLLAAGVAVELFLTGLLAYNSKGAWLNYGLQAAVFGSVLAARTAAAAFEGPARAWRVVPVALVMLAVLADDLRSVLSDARRHVASVFALRAVAHDLRARGRAPGEVYFVALPQYNRVLGRAELIHDEWLYGMFERVGAAEPRALWLRPTLTDGPVRTVIVPRDPPFPMPLRPPVVPGLYDPLPRLGYALVATRGRFQVWERGPGRHDWAAGGGK
jgi:hypothetical protein